VRYPDYYGIDMSSMEEFIAFRAAIALLEDRGMTSLIAGAYHEAKRQQEAFADKDTNQLKNGELQNFVKEIYAPFSAEEISAKMIDLLTTERTKAEVSIVYQTLDGLHAACPDHPGDWYFSGDYPTPGGTRLVNEAFIRFMENSYLKESGKLIMDC
jgi:amidophosphoribosyltransferase